MRNDTPVVIRRQDYSPPTYLVDRLELHFDLHPERTRVVAESTLRRNPDAAAGDIQLDGEALRLVEVAIDGKALDAGQYTLTPERLTLHVRPDGARMRIVTEIDAAANTTLSGLYVSNGNFFTQCEAEGFRRITYFPDRPDVMARYTVTLRADATTHPVLLSNGNLVAEGRDDDGSHWARWEDPFPKPSYLFALVAGRFVAREERLVTGSGRNALLQVWVEPGNEDKTGHAMQSLVRAIRWDEQRFGLELDLDRFMIVAVGDFNMGAMENKGLNVFNTRYVFANPRIATDTDFGNVESVVGHEYFHNWTGNRVTCRDWFQLTLKEGLTVFRDQEFSADMLAAEAASPEAARSARAVKRIEDVRLLRTAQFPEDAGPMAHPIRPDAYQEINNFYTVTIYEKGAEVIRMLQTLVGRDGFRKGMDLYFQRHDGQAVTCDDFVAAIADANGRDLSQFGRWYAQAGTPRVLVTTEHDAAAGRLRMTLRQICPPTPGQPVKQALPIPFALGLLGPDGRDLPLRLAGEAAAGAGTRVFELTADETVLEFVDLPQRPVPSLLRDFSAPVVVEYAWDEAELAFLAAHDSDPFNRWEACQRLGLSCIVAQMTGLAADAAANAQATQQLSRLATVFAGVLSDPGLDPAFKELALTLPSEGYVAEQLGIVDPGVLRAARTTVRAGLARQLAAEWRATWDRHAPTGAYSPDAASAGRRALANLALTYLCAADDPAAWALAYDRLVAGDNMTDRIAALSALVNSPSPQREPALARFATEFADEPLVMDKWFTLQATMHRQAGDPPVLERVTNLLAHPAFSLKNPNKVRALVGAFCTGNLAEFHAADGSGYAFWAQHVLDVGRLNPQVAARLARALDRWRKFTPDRQAAMRAALERVAAAPDLSADVSEIVNKALAA